MTNINKKKFFDPINFTNIQKQVLGKINRISLEKEDIYDESEKKRCSNIIPN